MAIFDNILFAHKISEIGMSWFFVIKNQDNPDKIRTVGRYANPIKMVGDSKS